MGSNPEKKLWTNLQTLYKNEAKGLRATTLSDNQRGSNREKFKYCYHNIGTYPISPFKVQTYLVGLLLNLFEAGNYKECNWVNIFVNYNNYVYKRETTFIFKQYLINRALA